MGKTDIHAGDALARLQGPDDPELLDALYSDAFGAARHQGVEFEFMAYEADTMRALGEPGSRLTPGDFMERLHRVATPEAQLVTDPENGYPCGVWWPHGGRFCLENGGQLEYASSIHPDMDALASELEWALGMCEAAAGGEIRFLSHGTHPTLEPRLDPMVPSSRYRVMERYFHPLSIHRWGNYACSIQVNLDVPTHQDWQQAFRLGFMLSRFAYHLFANSGYLHGQRLPHRAARRELVGLIDPRRREVPPAVVLAPDVVAAYRDWALEADVLFVRGQELEAMPRRGELTFRRWIMEGYRGVWPDAQSWALHLGTLWPDVRPRRYLELRATDCQPFPMVMGVVAFWRALIQEPAGHAAVRDFLASLPELSGASEEARWHDLLSRPADDPLFTTGRHHDALLELAASVLATTPDRAWARALRAYREFYLTQPTMRPWMDARAFVEATGTATPAAAFRAYRTSP